MSLSSWRQFPFFEGTPIKDPYYGSGNDALYSDPGVTAICSTDKYLAIATTQSLIKLVNSNFEKIDEFQAYDLGWSITKLAFFRTSNSTLNPNSQSNSNQYQTSNQGFLVTLAERQGFPLSLKLWNLDKLLDPRYNKKKFDYNSSYHTICNITNGSNNYPMTCFSYSSDYTILTFGFSNGTVILVRGDLLHDRGTRQRVIYENKEPITSIHFRDYLTLYISTVSKVFTLSTTGKNYGHLDKILDDKLGSDINCSSIYIDNNNNRSLLISRDDNFQIYNLKGKSHSIQLNVSKKRAYIYKNRYILFLSSVNSNLTESSTISNNKLIILDLKNNFIVYNQSIFSAIFEIFEIWNDLYILLSDGSLFKLHEKVLKDKVNILINRELFQLAIKLTNENANDFTKTEIMNLKKLYGNYLYNKGEFSDSIDQFIDCIPLGKTSEIISKFKESSKIQFLIKYLENIVDLEISTVNHINLLLTSYCKLKKFEEFEKFIENIEIDEDFEIIKDFKKFDLKSIIQLCKDNEYYQLALMIAEKFNLSSTVVSIQLHDIGDPSLTINYAKSLNIDDLLRVLIDNVKHLLNSLPNETTQLLIDVFTGKYVPKSRDLETDKEILKEESESSNSYPLLTSYKQFVSFMSSKEENGISNEIDVEEGKENKSIDEIEQTNLESVVLKPTYQPPRPRIIFSNFVNHNYEFVIFLEACIESYDAFDGNINDKKDIMNTLYEMYLTLAKEDAPNCKEWESKAKQLLNERTEWTEEDKTSLLLISNMYDFSEGDLIIRESTDNIDSIEGFELDIFRSAVFSGNILKSFEIVEKYGKKEHELYKLALSTYTSNDQFVDRIGEDRLKNILATIESLKILTPLEVLDCLTSGIANIKLGLIKDYLLRSIEKQKAEIRNNENLVNAYDLKMADLNKHIKELTNEPKIINTNKCSVCSEPLEFPIVYFKCGHQVHESCLIENVAMVSTILDDANENSGINSGYVSCPICSSEHDALMMLKKQQQNASIRQDLFEASLKGSDDRFKTMFGFLGRGAMETANIVTDGGLN